MSPIEELIKPLPDLNFPCLSLCLFGVPSSTLSTSKKLTLFCRLGGAICRNAQGNHDRNFLFGG